MILVGLTSFFLIKPSPYLFWKILAWVLYALAVILWFGLGQVALKSPCGRRLRGSPLKTEAAQLAHWRRSQFWHCSQDRLAQAQGFDRNVPVFRFVCYDLHREKAPPDIGGLF